MKRLVIACSFLLTPAFAQVSTIPNTTFPSVRALMNANFSWLNTNKAGNSSCPSNEYAIQTTTAGVVCASLTSLQISGALGFTPATSTHTHTGVYEPVDATILRQANLAGSGSASTPARSDHNHTGTYEVPLTFSSPFSRSVNTISLSVGTSAGTVAAGNDSRFTDARTPTTHASTHAGGGTDPVTLSQSQITNLVSDMAAKAALANPAFTGNPTAPTQSQGNNSTRIATTAYVDTGLATKAGIALALCGKGTYDQMTATSSATCPTDSAWLLKNASSPGSCAQPPVSGTASYSVCIRDGNGVWQPTTGINTTGGSGGTTTNGGSTTTVYGGWTGGGSTVTVSDADCASGNDTSTVQTKLSSLSSGGTLDFQNTTNPCDISTSGLSVSGKTNIRITTSVTPPSSGTIRGIAPGLYSNDESSIIYLSGCNNCLVDKIKLNGNSTKGQGVKFYSSDNFSIQNVEVYNLAYDSGGSGPYAALKTNGCSNVYLVSNNLHDLTGIDGGEGVRGIWSGVGGQYDVNVTIKDNTVANTGHTAIVTESSHPVVTGNIVRNALTQGTGMKFIARGTDADAVFSNNTIDGTKDAGFQEDPGTAHSGHYTYVTNNIFRNIGSVGTTFGALYLSGSSNNGVRFTGNTIDTARAIANINNATDVQLQNNTIINPQGTDGNNVNLEVSDHNITVINSGNVNMWDTCNPSTGGDCTFIYKDGVQLAFLPINRDVIVAMNRSILENTLSSL